MTSPAKGNDVKDKPKSVKSSDNDPLPDIGGLLNIHKKKSGSVSKKGKRIPGAMKDGTFQPVDSIF
jgi:hypothetical protein